jgi:hypothetical protein
MKSKRRLFNSVLILLSLRKTLAPESGKNIKKKAAAAKAEAYLLFHFYRI